MTPSKQLCKKLIPRSLALALVVCFLLSVVTPPLSVSASTTIGGQITSDTTWTKANSPYIVTSSVLVSEEVTLTIEPGVVVKFESGKAMQINGELIARGTEDEPIVFTSNQLSPAPGDWCNILFTDSSVDATYDAEGNYLSGCILQYCRVEYGGGGDNPAIKVSDSSLFIDHCIIANNNSSGVYVDSGSVIKITNNVIYNSSTYDFGGGIHASGWLMPVDISANTIFNNSAGWGGGIYAVGWSVRIANNLIANNSADFSGGGIYLSIGEHTVSHNNIVGNSASGIYISFMEPIVSLNDNNIHGNAPYDVYDGAEAGSPAVDATYNWWGTTDETEIQAHIYDWFDDASLGIVNYFPYFTEPVLLKPSPPTGLTAESAGAVIELNWQAVSGATGYKVYYDVDSGFPYQGTGANEGDSPIDVGNSTSLNISGLSLGTRYYFAVTAYNSEGESWYSEEVSAVPTDATPPITPVVTDDGDTTTNTTQLHAVWVSSDPESGIAEYQYAIGTFPAGTDVVPWTSAGTNTEVTHTGLNLTIGTAYFAVKAKNGQGLWSEAGMSDGITVIDATAPTTPVVTDDGDTTTSTTQLHAAWVSSDLESGISEYQYAIGTSPGGTDVVPWTSVGTNTGVTHTGLNLSVETTYYFAVKAKNGQGLWSAAGVSDGITVQSPPNQPPNQPSNISPIDGVSGISLTPTLQSSGFSDPDAVDTHAASQWQITTTSGDYSNPVFDGDRDTQNLENISIPSEKLSYSTTCYWRVRHQDNNGAWSEWSIETSFTTVPSPAPTGGGFPFWAWIVIGVGAAVVIGIVVGWRLARR